MRIKVTGYIDTDDLSLEDVDTAHETGLSESGYTKYVTNPHRLSLSEVEFEATND